ncbi:STAS domain-containing protein [Streptomyces sp. NBC_00158]|uniref:STAS domain-containing protein n=1 Tax=Streptomyces sp. NBC_00158 TaxID=2903627 RepID=UPI00324C841A
MRTFEIDVAMRPGGAVVTVTGDLDLATCPHLIRATDTIPLEGRMLTLELSAVTFMDSTGLNMLLGLRERARAEGGTLDLAGLPEQARNVLDHTSTSDLFALRPGRAA